mgnify:CR=1 FL=1
MKLKSHILDEKSMSRAIVRISHEIMEHNDNPEDMVIIGIKTRGVPIAERISDCIFSKIDGSAKIPVAVLDITSFRDDNKDKTLKKVTHLPVETDGKTVILVDDVIYTGRTVRAAMDAIMSASRPNKIQLAAMVDRGHRELPIRPDYVGKNIPTSRSESIEVKLREIDGKDVIDIYE